MEKPASTVGAVDAKPDVQSVGATCNRLAGFASSIIMVSATRFRLPSGNFAPLFVCGLLILPRNGKANGRAATVMRLRIYISVVSEYILLRKSLR